MAIMADPTDRWTDALIRLCRTETTSGREDRGLGDLLDYLRESGAAVTTEKAADGRTNVLALFGRPDVLFTTHLDTVPPYFPPEQDGGTIRGRGTADAKGQIVAQVEAARSLAAEGLCDVAWMGLVGEETDALGARAAARFADRLRDVRLIVNGEPTEGALGTGQRGYLHLRLSTNGTAAHSGMPERGRSAILDLLDWIAALRREPVRVDPRLGPEVWNVGTISGGVAANVIPDRASAEILCRTVPGSTFRERIEALRPKTGTIECLVDEDHCTFGEIEGFAYRPMPFGSDLPALKRLFPAAAVALAGPGSITVAHTLDEQLAVADLRHGVETNRRLAGAFLSKSKKQK